MSQLKKDGKMHDSLYGIQEGWEPEWNDTLDDLDPVIPLSRTTGFIGALGPKVFRDATTGQQLEESLVRAAQTVELDYLRPRRYGKKFSGVMPWH